MTELLYLDSDLVIINKAIGVATEELLGPSFRFIPESFQQQSNYLEAIHRIDQPISGVLVMGRTKDAVRAVSEQFRNQSATREYWAVCQPPEDHREITFGTMRDLVVFDRRRNKSRVVTGADSGEAQEAIMLAEKVGETDRYWVLRLKLLTGRHHQIRAQLGARGMPIVGDLKYGARRSKKGGGIYLHAYSVTFVHPSVPLPLRISAPLPDPDRLWSAAREMFSSSSGS